MKTVLVTGAKGFIGKNLCLALKALTDIQLVEYDLGSSDPTLEEGVAKADAICHLAGINRPKDEVDYEAGNAGFTGQLLGMLEAKGKRPVIIATSSIQAKLENPYGLSKRHAEVALESFAAKTDSVVHIYRLPNVFGKWCRPFYNSVIATFCYQATHGGPFKIDNPSNRIEFVYVDDVVSSFIGAILGTQPQEKEGYRIVQPTFHVTIGELAEKLTRFVELRKSCVLPELSDPFEKRLYSTYLSYLENDAFAYATEKKEDTRGYLFELLKSRHAGQVFVSRTYPGITRGNHYHHTKVEKFCVVEGLASIVFRHMVTEEKVEYEIEGKECRVIDIPPGWTHKITNIGKGDLITLFWANEIFSPEQPDTHFAEV